MNSDDPKLTAYALGELEGAEREEIDQLLRGDLAAREEVAALQAFTSTLRNALHAEAAPGLTDEQRAEVFAAEQARKQSGEGAAVVPISGATTPATSAANVSRSRRWWIPSAIAASVALLLGFWALPHLRETPQIASAGTSTEGKPALETPAIALRSPEEEDRLAMGRAEGLREPLADATGKTERQVREQAEDGARGVDKEEGKLLAQADQANGGARSAQQARALGYRSELSRKNAEMKSDEQEAVPAALGKESETQQLAFEKRSKAAVSDQPVLTMTPPGSAPVAADAVEPATPPDAFKLADASKQETVAGRVQSTATTAAASKIPAQQSNKPASSAVANDRSLIEHSIARVAAPAKSAGGAPPIPALTPSAEPAASAPAGPGESTYALSAPIALGVNEENQLADANRALRDMDLYTAHYAADVPRTFTYATLHPVSVLVVNSSTLCTADLKAATDARTAEAKPAPTDALVNSFAYNYPPPTQGPLSVAMELGACPWAPDHQLLLVGVRARNAKPDETPDSPIASNVRVEVDFNPEKIAAYRPLDGESRDADKSTAQAGVEAPRSSPGEMKAGQAVTALYELASPAAAPGAALLAQNVDGQQSVYFGNENASSQDEKKGAAAAKESGAKRSAQSTLLTLTLSWTDPNGSPGVRVYPFTGAVQPWDDATPDFRWAAAVANISLLLHDPAPKSGMTWETALRLGREAEGNQPKRAEFLQSIQYSAPVAQPQTEQGQEKRP